MSVKWHIGCSGFHYKEWKGAFYPENIPKRLWFEYYTRHFNTLELNTTFYKFPTLRSLQCWHNDSPEGFVFSAKVPRSVTHFKKFNGTSQLLNDFYQVLREGLKEKLGCVLIQLPPQFVYQEASLEKILQQIDPAFNNVIEFRHPSWWREDVIQKLTLANISFCGVSFPAISMDHPVLHLPLTYYRFHGVPVLFHSEYEEAFIDRIYRQIKNNTLIETAFIYFNNTASMAALKNARYFKVLTS